MNYVLFDQNWARLNKFQQKAFKDYARNRTNNNSAYMVGYLGACADHGLLTDVGYWLSVTDSTEALNHIQHLKITTQKT